MYRIIRRKELLRMKATTILGSLLLSVALCSPSFGCVELLGRLLGLENCDDCGCAACAPCQSCCNACRPARVCVPDAPCCGSAVCERPCRLPAVCKRPCCAPVRLRSRLRLQAACKLRCKVREVLCNIRDLFHCKRCCCDCGAVAAAAAAARHAAGKAAMSQRSAAALLLRRLLPRRPGRQPRGHRRLCPCPKPRPSRRCRPTNATSLKVHLALGCRYTPRQPNFFLAAYRRYTLPGGWAITSDFSPSGRASCMPGVR